MFVLLTISNNYIQYLLTCILDVLFWGARGVPEDERRRGCDAMPGGTEFFFLYLILRPMGFNMRKAEITILSTTSKASEYCCARVIVFALATTKIIYARMYGRRQ